MQEQNITSLAIFVKEVQHFSYSEKYKKWVQYLEKVEASSPEQYLTALTLFLEQFPFNYVYWLAFVHYSENTLAGYELALKRNSKSFQLWSAYLLALKNHNCEPTKYKKQLERAIFEVGADTRSISLYEEYYPMISQNFRYQFYKKIMTRALIGIEEIFQKFKIWLNQLSQSQIQLFYAKQLRGAVSSTDQTNQFKKTYLFEQIQQSLKKTLNYRSQRLKIEDKIERYYYDGSQKQKEELVFWKQLLDLERRSGIIENVSYCYQRSLMAQTENYDLWDEAFHYLEHQTNKYAKVLSILRNNKAFFLKFNNSIYFYWCEMEERENAHKARDMYKEICSLSPSLETYQRYIQFQIRQKDYNTAKDLYDTLLGMYNQQYEKLAYILVEYSHFVLKYYKDYEYPKQLLKGYFDYLPYNSYLLTQYLMFLQHFQNNQGYYDQLMVILCEAVKKAKKALRQVDFLEAISMIKYYLRTNLGSIYLIKLSERKILELAESLQNKNEEQITLTNNNHHQQIHPQLVQSVNP